MPVGVYTGAQISIGNGVTTVFPYGWKILSDAHIEVKVDGVVKVLGADYTVSGVGASNGGNVTFLVAPANLAVVQRARKVPYKRDNDYQANGDLKEETIDGDFDLEEMQIQQISLDVMRAFKAPLSVTADQVLADAMWAARAGLMLGFDGAGNLGVFAALNPANPASAYILTLLDDANATAARATLGLSEGVSTGSIIDAKGDLIVGTANDTPARKAVGVDGYPLTGNAGAADGLTWQPPSLGFNLVGGYLDWTVAGSVLTCAVKTWAGNDPSAAEPVYYPVRDVTPATGSLTYRKLTAALSLSINNTALMGTINNAAFRLWASIFNDAGTDRLSLINCLLTSTTNPSIYPLAGWGIASAVLSDNASDNAHVFYANAAVAAKAYSVVGYATWEAGLAAAGVWSAAPTRKQLFGPGVPLPGAVLQEQYTFTSAAGTGATGIPNDDTIPQSTEGDQYFSLAITPSSAANVIESRASLQVAVNAAARVFWSLFQDAVANAIAAGYGPFMSSADVTGNVNVFHRFLAALTTATTIKLRLGPDAGTITLNGAVSARKFGGAMVSYLQHKEIMA